MRDSIVFFLNGQRQEIAGSTANLTLAAWLREHQRLVGTKVVCNEGDCGACSVLVGRPTKDGDQLDYRPIDSCIAFPFQLDKTHVVSVEGLKQDDCLSPVQQAMVDCHGSQCGFCTPGFVATMHGMLEKQPSLDEASLRYGLSGNLCRCTGYVQIIEAGKSIDPASVVRMNDQYAAEPMLQAFAELGDDTVHIDTGDVDLFLPTTIHQAIELLSQNSGATVVAGATDYGVLHNHGRVNPTAIISLCSIADFGGIEVNDGQLCIGGGATWTDIEAFVRDRVPQYYEILTRFGSPQIRNAGTLAGNLAGGSPIGDSIPFHIVMDSELELTGPDGSRRVKLNDFYTGYRQNVMADDELITSIITPLPQDDERVSLHKISRRRDMDISTETLGLWVKLAGKTIQDVRLALGGVGATVMRMTNAEKFLAGKTFGEDNMRQAGRLASADIKPWSDVRGSDQYRLQLAENLVVRAYRDIQREVMPNEG